MDRAKRIPAERRYPTAGSIEFNNLSNRDQRHLDRAFECAAARTVDYHNHCAIVVKGGRVLATGYNTQKNSAAALSDEHIRAVHGRNSVMGVGVHAEIAALRQVANPRGAVVYVARARRDGTPAPSAPCESCTEVLQRLGVKRVIFT